MRTQKKENRLKLRSRYTLHICIGLLLCGSGWGLFASDIAQFVNLGFSNDETVFMFGQFGVDSENSVPYADAFLVDVYANRYISGGILQFRTESRLRLGQNGLAALFNIISRDSQFIRGQNIDHTNSGRLVYLNIANEGSSTTAGSQTIRFRDYNTNDSFVISLQQNTRLRAGTSESSFHIQFRLESSAGSVVDKTVGLPGYFREAVLRYEIEQVILSPSGESAVIVVQRHEEDRNGQGGENIRYMVETIRLR